MKSIINKNIFVFCIVFSMNACHTFEHQNILFQNINKNSDPKLLDKENKNSKVSGKENKENSEMAPIDRPKQTEKVEMLALQKKVKGPKPKYFSLKKIVNWNEQRLINTLGKSNFIKEEGKLKNYQYYFKECFLDVFLIKKKENYIVNYVETRPTKLNGKININACLKEINQTLN